MEEMQKLMVIVKSSIMSCWSRDEGKYEEEEEEGIVFNRDNNARIVTTAIATVDRLSLCTVVWFALWHTYI